MKNTFKKIVYVLSAAALITVGAANVYAMDSHNQPDAGTAYEAWEDRNTSNRIS